jgi:hypothetical protein
VKDDEATKKKRSVVAKKANSPGPTGAPDQSVVFKRED